MYLAQTILHIFEGSYHSIHCIFLYDSHPRSLDCDHNSIPREDMSRLKIEEQVDWRKLSIEIGEHLSEHCRIQESSTEITSGSYLK